MTLADWYLMTLGRTSLGRTSLGRTSLGRTVLGLAIMGLITLAPIAVVSQDNSVELAIPSRPSDASTPVDYLSQIQPLLRSSCYSCHGAEKQESGLRLDLKGRAFAGGDTGPVIKPGHSSSSRLIQAVTGHDDVVGIMPPQDAGTPLSDSQIRLLRDWIDQGAGWPDDANKQQSENHWSFQPVSVSTLPGVVQRSWVRNSIDAFILARLEQHGVTPSPEADRPTLIRRLFLDLLGLPPSPQQVSDFLVDSSPDAYERLVERLLASPHFGERWARHWLDLARYADSDGYEKDRPRPNAWRYRSWVISMLNADLPYDQFTVRQLAGDLLPGESTEHRVASGFHTNTLHNTEGGADQEEDRVKKTVDRTNTLGAIWLGMTVGCAQCHSHKYDPLPQREYFSLYAFFNNLDEIAVEAPLPIDYERVQREKTEFNAEHQPFVDALTQYEEGGLLLAQADWEALFSADRDRGDSPKQNERLPASVSAALTLPASERTPEKRQAIADHFRTIDSEFKNLKKRVSDHLKMAPPKVMARAVAEHPQDRETRLHIRGDFLNPGQPVPRVTPSVLPPLVPRGDGPDRLDLARWLVDAEHPLTARVTANRMWRRLLGRAIVTTVDDFGMQGELPSHPSLLDWLAAEFIRSRWSVKNFVRMVVTSSTYRQSSAARPELSDEDPENEWLARQSRHRVEGEVIRDLALSVSGLLDHRVGGRSVRPRQPGEYAGLTYANSAKWQVSKGGDAYRRGLYTFFQRTSPYPMLMTFDSPDSNICCAERSLSNTPLQALTLWNDPVFFECAQALGKRISVFQDFSPTADPDRQRARFAFRLCLSRNPAVEELSELLALYSFQHRQASADIQTARAIVGDDHETAENDLVELAAWTVVGRILLNLDEFISRE
jgi:mono/diheme cytochrome c family protein